MNKPLALVTGANKGIGLETCRQLALKGFRVILSARSLERGEQATKQLVSEGLDVEFLQIDVGDSGSIQAAVESITSRFSELDVLVNNAGVQIESDIWGTNTVESISMSTLRETMDVNFFGMVELTQLLLPLLRKAKAARIVNLTSILGSLEYHATPGSNTYNTKTFGYNTSKVAVNSFTIHLAHLLRDTPIKVNSAHPGWVATDMGGAEAPLDLEVGAETTVWLATLDEAGPTGGYFHRKNRLPW